MSTPYPDAYADDDAWLNAESEHEGKIRLLRIRNRLAAFSSMSRYPITLCFDWQYSVLNSSELPSVDDLVQMKTFEDSLVRGLERTRSAIFTYCHTGSGHREWHFQITCLEAVQTELDLILNQFPDLPLTIRKFEDSEWLAFNKLVLKLR